MTLFTKYYNCNQINGDETGGELAHMGE